MLPVAERVRLLAHQGVSVDNIAVRLGLEPETVRLYLDVAAPKRKRGRPASKDRCASCGAPPSHQTRRDAT